MDSSMDTEQMGPQNFLYGCELRAGKDTVFNPEDDEYEHQLSLRMVCVDPSTKDELHVVEVEGQDSEGQTVRTVLASLRPSTLPSVCLGGFEITPPVLFRLKAGSGPVHISGQHLMVSEDMCFGEEEDEEEEEESRKSVKRPAGVVKSKPQQKKMKLEEEEDDDEDDEDEEDDDDEDDEDEDDEEESEEEEETPVKQTPKTPKTPNTKGQGDRKPQTPRAPLSLAEIKAKMMVGVEKGVMLPKVEAKFENFVKNGFKVDDKNTIQELWKWRQTVKDKK
ncbi:NPM protein, partial [Atractosteus spatula]|nr:NPM protein [Atractosteus spatula]